MGDWLDDSEHTHNNLISKGLTHVCLPKNLTPLEYIGTAESNLFVKTKTTLFLQPTFRSTGLTLKRDI